MKIPQHPPVVNRQTGVFAYFPFLLPMFAYPVPDTRRRIKVLPNLLVLL